MTANLNVLEGAESAETDSAMLLKTYGQTVEDQERKYGPAKFVSSEKQFLIMFEALRILGGWRIRNRHCRANVEFRKWFLLKVYSGDLPYLI